MGPINIFEHEWIKTNGSLFAVDRVVCCNARPRVPSQKKVDSTKEQASARVVSLYPLVSFLSKG